MNNTDYIPAESVEDVIARMKKGNIQSTPMDNSLSHGTESTLMQESSSPERVSKNITPTSPSERKNKINAIVKQLIFGQLSQGNALKKLRIEILGLKQDVFAKMVGVSRKTISDIENDRGHFKADILDKVFKPFGLKIGLIPSSPEALKALFD
ncbi:helix-turn-helix transcriptional regulator [Photobacterium leiognathi]|uniref:helix-turn-helix transcriptional regulator n=1 Tax=Photobacterium leiognathi TaxID=553611 RepID=UPI00298140AC|nr:helix-turn-helix transcriptional regulator [Photobacterium leiognathi]